MAVANTSEPKYGGHDHDFVETVPDRFMCSTVCTRVLNNPHLTSCCGQHVCEICLNYWFEKHRDISCPHCRAKGEDFHHFLDKKLKREIAELKIHCIHKDKGCQWRGELEKLDDHIESEDGCGFVEVDCPNCPNRDSLIILLKYEECPTIYRKDLHEHMSNQCIFRSVICAHCKQKQRYFHRLDDHHTICPQYPLPCPNKCGIADIPRENVSTHRDTCPLEPVECPFAEAGCQTKLIRKELHKHTVSDQQTHLQQLMANYSQTKTDLARTQQNLATTQQDLATTKQTSATQLDLATTQQALATSQRAFAATQQDLATMKQSLATTQLDLAMSQQAFAKMQLDLVTTQQALVTTQQALATTLEALAKTQEARATKDFKPTIKSILNNLGTPESKIDKKGQEHGLQFTIPGENYFKDNKMWCSPAFYVRTFKTCVRAELNTQTGGLDWSLVVLGTERSECRDLLTGKVEGWSTINFHLPCINNLSEMYMQNALKASCKKILTTKGPQTLTVFIHDFIKIYCEKCH